MWLNKLQENFELMEYEKGIKSKFTGHGKQTPGMSIEDSFNEVGGQVVRCGKVGRFVLYLSFKPFGEIRRLKNRIAYLKQAIKKNGDMYVTSGMAKKELEDIASKDYKAINYLWGKTNWKLKKGKGITGFINFLNDLLREIPYIQGALTGQSEIYDRGSNMLLVEDEEVDRVYNWCEEECTKASEFFDSLGLPVGKNIPLVVDVNAANDGSSGSAARSNHYITLKYLRNNTLVHETAHYMWFYSMDADMRKKVALYFLTKVSDVIAGPSGSNMMGAFSAGSSSEYTKNKSKFGGKPILPSGYSTFSPSELWAEMIVAIYTGKASQEIKRLFRIVATGEYSDLIKYFNIDPQVAEEYLNGSKTAELEKAINLSGKKPVK